MWRCTDYGHEYPRLQLAFVVGIFRLFGIPLGLHSRYYCMLIIEILCYHSKVILVFSMALRVGF